MDGGRGCPTYRALECFEEGELSGDPKARASRDVWAFAIVIVEVRSDSLAFLPARTRAYTEYLARYSLGRSLTTAVWMPLRCGIGFRIMAAHMEMRSLCSFRSLYATRESFGRAGTHILTEGLRPWTSAMPFGHSPRIILHRQSPLQLSLSWTTK